MDFFAFWKVIPGAGEFLRVALPALLFVVIVVIGWGMLEDWFKNLLTGKKGGRMTGRGRQMTAEEKGRIGEDKVRTVLSELDASIFPRRFGLHLIASGGKSTQIDAVVFSRFGIFVIEVKNLSGVVYGGQDDEHWTALYPDKRHTLPNPLRQNAGHIAGLQAITGLPRNAFHSLVVFAGSAKVDLADDAKSKEAGSGKVIYLDELKDCIANQREEILSEGDVTQAIADTMRAEDNAPDAAERHKESLRSRRR